jgi:[NiFe] hydrogenase assembly HybE family chaperone
MTYPNNPDRTRLHQLLEDTYRSIQLERLQSVPIINPALQVQAVDFRIIHKDWLGVLITPWFMNLLLLPLDHKNWANKAPGDKFSSEFPSGRFEFIVGHEQSIGLFASCSLFSPMFQFSQQEHALSAAQAALHALLTAPPQPVSPGISRRNLLRGQFRGVGSA